MQYMLIAPEEQMDFGFGITAESYYHSANFLFDNQEHLGFHQQKEAPTNYLYRHSIELFLKSLIILFHKKLKISYQNESYESKKPIIFINGQWRPLYKCHWINGLFCYWLDDLYLKHEAKIKQMAPNGDWSVPEDVMKLFEKIKIYDTESDYFRYPITTNTHRDYEKYDMRKIDLNEKKNLFIRKNEEESKKIYLLYEGKNEEIVGGYVSKDNVLEDIKVALREVSNYLYCVHTMTRMTLFEGK